MPRHSKNNTAGSVFTYHETKSLEYGTKRQRLGRESFRDFDACFLCLQTARDPVACSKGHLACRECLYEAYLQQKQTIKREQLLLEQKLADLEEKKRQTELETKQALLNEFEKTQTSMLNQRIPFSTNNKDNNNTSSSSSSSIKNNNNNNNDKNTSETSSVSQISIGKGVKRKLEDEINTNSERNIQKASEKIENSKASPNTKLKSSFWLPTMTPHAEIQTQNEIKPIQTQPLCHATKETHPLTMKGLIEVKFHKDSDGKPTCPACLKSLSNSTKLSVMRQCGHVICQKCVDMFVKKTKKCYVCEEKTKTKDIIDMTIEGTGYTSGSSVAIAERFDLSFQ
ncbi:hypothetical protein BJ944DRAFT_249566 [Cunninghamella echinulata]|nr:hypothetical protein BJ944DRAFT_249566 [Cunninghamella echinulata]